MGKLKERFEEDFSDDSIATIVASQVPIEMLTTSFELRKTARASLKEKGLDFFSEEARPYRESLDANRPEAVPVWKVPLSFKAKKEGEGKRGGRKGDDRRGGNRGGGDGRSKAREMPPAQEMGAEEIDVIMKAIEEAS